MLGLGSLRLHRLGLHELQLVYSRVKVEHGRHRSATGCSHTGGGQGTRARRAQELGLSRQRTEQWRRGRGTKQRRGHDTGRATEQLRVEQRRRGRVDGQQLRGCNSAQQRLRRLQRAKQWRRSRYR